jgi:hypothetical protein
MRRQLTARSPKEIPVSELAILAALVLGATALSSAAAAVLIGHLKPTELLRDDRRPWDSALRGCVPRRVERVRYAAPSPTPEENSIGVDRDRCTVGRLPASRR